MANRFFQEKKYVLAEYLEQRHWADTRHPPDKVDRRREAADATTYQYKIRHSRGNTDSSPHIKMKLYKCVDEGKLRLLAKILHEMWIEELYPNDFAPAEVAEVAEIVSMYKTTKPRAARKSQSHFLAELLVRNLCQNFTETNRRRH